MDLVRLACVRHAASVRPEPGSNSPSRIWLRNDQRPSRAGVEGQTGCFDSESRVGVATAFPTGTVRIHHWRDVSEFVH